MSVTQRIDMNKVEYALGVSYKEALDMLNRTVNNLYTLIEVLQDRVLELEIESDRRGEHEHE